ncbi:hypothetical protein SAMD00019534_077320 [Acytostelium subglobosum LB1]|uniref:hypothetical protein n=1 Tax=Acytostelium subglobosum LB1 TaxID=1410327 RepID=UPI000644EBC2|nr:hypothetical protein SAMD00019534_077320 [Acytostelium subglobosum LB1]GAM24557.1 hypothetical protein SAMD00019534_077320 [Acytostelium subglobosum LB1]|eukprot:XP_012752226.1 hypothetical protein SAMD00019534_077320 [Acytostelium subglobosum LB1]
MDKLVDPPVVESTPTVTKQVIPDYVLDQWRKDFVNLEVQTPPQQPTTTTTHDDFSVSQQPVQQVDQPVVQHQQPSPAKKHVDIMDDMFQGDAKDNDKRKQKDLMDDIFGPPPTTPANTTTAAVSQLASPLGDIVDNNSGIATSVPVASTTDSASVPPEPPKKKTVIDMDLGVYGLPVNTTVRGVFWKVALGALSNESKSEWREQTRKQRTKYDTLKRVYIIDPRTKKVANAVVDDPLSLNKDSVWNQFFENETTQKEIGHDITRTYPDVDFFGRKDIQETMTRILFIFSRQYPKIKYLQGMNEILAPLLFACYADSHWGDYRQVYRLGQPVNEYGQPVEIEYPAEPIAYPHDELDLASYIRDARFYEHDTYFLFDALMSLVSKWFSSPPNSPMPTPILAGVKKEQYDQSESEAHDASINIVVVDQCFSIFHQLGIIDPQLHAYLKDMGIEPHLYALRWLRILLAQVFPLNSLLTLWDAMFRESIDLLDHICVAMLLVVRDLLIGRDYSDCLQVLFNYPMTNDPTSLLFTAYSVAERIKTIKAENPTINFDYQSEKERPKPKPKARPHYNMNKKSATMTYSSSSSAPGAAPSINNSTSQSSSSSSSSRAKMPAQKTTTQPQNDTKAGGGFLYTVASTVKMLVNELNDLDSAGEIEALKEKQMHLASRLERVVYILDTVRNVENAETIQSVQEELISIKKVLNPKKELPAAPPPSQSKASAKPPAKPSPSTAKPIQPTLKPQAQTTKTTATTTTTTTDTQQKPSTTTTPTITTTPVATPTSAIAVESTSQSQQQQQQHSTSEEYSNQYDQYDQSYQQQYGQQQQYNQYGQQNQQQYSQYDQQQYGQQQQQYGQQQQQQYDQYEQYEFHDQKQQQQQQQQPNRQQQQYGQQQYGQQYGLQYGQQYGIQNKQQQQQQQYGGQQYQQQQQQQQPQQQYGLNQVYGLLQQRLQFQQQQQPSNQKELKSFGGSMYQQQQQQQQQHQQNQQPQDMVEVFSDDIQNVDTNGANYMEEYVPENEHTNSIFKY